MTWSGLSTMLQGALTGIYLLPSQRGHPNSGWWCTTDVEYTLEYPHFRAIHLWRLHSVSDLCTGQSRSGRLLTLMFGSERSRDLHLEYNAYCGQGPPNGMEASGGE